MNLRSAPCAPALQETLIESLPSPFRTETPAPRAMLACFGVACPSHGRCARYAAVDSSAADQDTLVSCRSGIRFPLFVAIAEPVQALAA